MPIVCIDSQVSLQLVSVSSGIVPAGSFFPSGGSAAALQRPVAFHTLFVQVQPTGQPFDELLHLAQKHPEARTQTRILHINGSVSDDLTGRTYKRIVTPAAVMKLLEVYSKVHRVFIEDFEWRQDGSLGPHYAEELPVAGNMAILHVLHATTAAPNVVLDMVARYMPSLIELEISFSSVSFLLLNGYALRYLAQIRAARIGLRHFGPYQIPAGIALADSANVNARTLTIELTPDMGSPLLVAAQPKFSLAALTELQGVIVKIPVAACEEDSQVQGAWDFIIDTSYTITANISAFKLVLDCDFDHSYNLVDRITSLDLRRMGKALSRFCGSLARPVIVLHTAHERPDNQPTWADLQRASPDKWSPKAMFEAGRFFREEEQSPAAYIAIHQPGGGLFAV